MMLVSKNNKALMDLRNHVLDLRRGAQEAWEDDAQTDRKAVQYHGEVWAYTKVLDAIDKRLGLLSSKK